jgi:hypothetical protein
LCSSIRLWNFSGRASIFAAIASSLFAHDSRHASPSQQRECRVTSVTPATRFACAKKQSCEPEDGILMLGRRLLQISFVAFVLVLAMFVPFYFTNLRVKNEPTSEPDLVAANSEAQPLLRGLEKYRADHGLYPATLDPISPAYWPSRWGVDRFRYSARRSDWTLKSEACAAREKSLHGWIMKSATEYAKEVGRFKLDCISGYHAYQLQSPDFPQSTQSPDVERWAYYDSFTRKWSLGWCHHDRTSRGRAQDSAMNGACRRRDDGVLSDPW